MLRLVFALVLLFHGLIHLMGFAKAYKYAEISQLTGTYSRAAGALWLFSALLLLVSAGLFLWKKEIWWMPAIAGLLLSQMLIFSQWQDARFGTIANIILLLGVLPAYGQWQWNRMVNAETKAFLPVGLPESSVLTREMIAGMPPVVQKWMERSGVIGRKMTRQVHLVQTGRMRTKPDGKWMPVTATQYFTIHQPGFLWTADVEAAPSVVLKGRDLYQNGQGHMLIKALALFPVTDAKGPTTDQGSLLRYLAEICWFPDAALHAFIQWEPIDDHSAKATLRYGKAEGSGIFTFDENGDIRSFEAMRYFSQKKGDTLEKWYIDMDPASFEVFEGVRIPTRSTVTWKLAEGDFSWFEVEIGEVSYEL